MLTFTSTGNLESLMNLTCISFDCERELEHPGETHVHGGVNMESPRRKNPADLWVWTQHNTVKHYTSMLPQLHQFKFFLLV